MSKSGKSNGIEVSKEESKYAQFRRLSRQITRVVVYIIMSKLRSEVWLVLR